MSKRSKGSNGTLASKADRHALYLHSVQEPRIEVKFFDRVFKKNFDRKPMLLREDFCGSAAVCYAWVRKREGRRAIGIDLDPDPLDWGRKHLAPKLKDEDLERVELRQQDVRQIDHDGADVLAAQNFSFYIFDTRNDLLEYFRAAIANLADEGVMVLDMMGGSESIEENREDETEHEGFTYIWDQARFDPISHYAKYHIHFRFPDRSEMREAFTYEWRFWTIPEVRELLLEAGFDHIDVYWEGTDPDTGEGSGKYRRRDSVESDPAWVCYLVAVKQPKG